MELSDVLNSVISVEGGYTNNPSDLGGETNWGITVATAHQHGYTGDMKDMTKDQALDIYMSQYVIAPQFDKVFNLSQSLGQHVIDCGVNMGITVSAAILQRALAVFSDHDKYYTIEAIDGHIGPNTLSALQAFLTLRQNDDGEAVLLKTINCLQGEQYIVMAETRYQNQDFVYGWMRNRIQM
jgi:lysozyme family protein